jgi:hypothetical protein
MNVRPSTGLQPATEDVKEGAVAAGGLFVFLISLVCVHWQLNSNLEKSENSKKARKGILTEKNIADSPS